VIIGIVFGELALATVEETSIALFLATLACIATVRALGGTPLAVAQGAAAAILTVTVGDSDVGPDRLIDALIGGGVALVFSQLLFTPEPLRLLRRAAPPPGALSWPGRPGERERRPARPARRERPDGGPNRDLHRGRRA
jgi:hypothetical protein